jgi:uncharacterized protein (TIGR03435 family)
MRIAPLLFTAALVLAQQRPAFDVASVKVSPPIGGTNTFVGVRVDAGRVHIANFGLGALIFRAYSIQSDQIVGIPSEFRCPLSYEIDATFPADTDKDQVPLMLQTLLADRFKLVAHRETRPTPIYALVVAKGGPKMKVSQEETMSRRNPRRGHYEAKKITIALLATYFHSSGWTDRPVIDKTGLTDFYDLVLDWTPDDVKSDDLSAPSLFTAVQEQLGLKLEAQTAPREVLVIDHVEKPEGN